MINHIVTNQPMLYAAMLYSEPRNDHVDLPDAFSTLKFAKRNGVHYFIT